VAVAVFEKWAAWDLTSPPVAPGDIAQVERRLCCEVPVALRRLLELSDGAELDPWGYEFLPLRSWYVKTTDDGAVRTIVFIDFLLGSYSFGFASRPDRNAPSQPVWRLEAGERIVARSMDELLALYAADDKVLYR
jgi:hypothetical protein